MPKKKIYLDYASTTPVEKSVFLAMQPFFSKKFGNTMSFHSFGRDAKMALEKAREKVADLIKARSTEIIFTGSATESNNLALKGIAFANKQKGNHIIISNIEHPCIIQSAKWLERQGFIVDKVKTDKDGLIDPLEIKSLINKKTILVSVMHANNEIGSIQPVKEIGRICKKAGIFFHTDAAQTLDKLEIDVNEMNIDLLTASSHKIYGPKGVGFLFIRENTRLEPILHGGGHEFGLRSSTINLSGIVGFAKACEIAKQKMKEENKRLDGLRNKLILDLSKIEKSKLNGSFKNRLPNNVNFSFDRVDGQALVLLLDKLGIAVSTGSACSTNKLTLSHVLSAIGLKASQIKGSIRFSLGRMTTKEEIDYVISIMPKVITNLRRL
jgi:cysteine desulfurase